MPSVRVSDVGAGTVCRLYRSGAQRWRTDARRQPRGWLRSCGRTGREPRHAVGSGLATLFLSWGTGRRPNGPALAAEQPGSPPQQPPCAARECDRLQRRH